MCSSRVVVLLPTTKFGLIHEWTMDVAENIDRYGYWTTPAVTLRASDHKDISRW